MTFKLRVKPKKPVRKNKKLNSINVCDADTLSELIRAVPDNVEYKDVQIEADWRYDEKEWRMCWYEEESEEDFNKRVKKYNVQNKAYQAWQEEFKLEILEEKQRKKNVAAAKEKARIEKAQAQLDKQLAALNKKLKK